MNLKNGHLMRQLLPNIIVISLLGISSITTNKIFNVASIIIAIVVMLFSKKENAYYLLIQIAAFESMIIINNRNVFSILVLIFCFKLVFSKKAAKMNYIAFLSVLLLFLLEFINDNPLLSGASPFSFINVSSFLLLFILWISNIDSMEIDTTKFVLCFNICVVIIIGVSFLSYGSILQFIRASKEAEYVYRLGTETHSSLAGAMGIPLFAAICVSVNIIFLIVNKSSSKQTRLFSIISICISVFGAVLSFSRSFYLCMIAFFGLLILFSIGEKKQRKKGFFVICITIIAVICFLTMDGFEWIISNVIKRSEEDSGVGIRGEIWISCLRYLSTHTRALLFGLGTINYPNIGKNIDELFSLSAHNLVFDIIMSYGVVGLIAICVLIRLAKLKLSRSYGNLTSKYCILPLLTFLTYGLTALRTFSGKTWIYFIMLMTFTYICGKNRSIKG